MTPVSAGNNDVTGSLPSLSLSLSLFLSLIFPSSLPALSFPSSELMNISLSIIIISIKVLKACSLSAAEGAFRHICLS